MTKIFQIWKCEICGNIIEVVHEGSDSLVCCGKPMNLLVERTKDIGMEKHVPVISGNIVKIGSIEHPMTEEHYIEWIEATRDNEKARIFLKPGMKPESKFSFNAKSTRAYCNVHGLWKSG